MRKGYSQIHPQQKSMIGLDTNILVRYITLDDPPSGAGCQIIETKLTRTNRIRQPLTIVEIAWSSRAFIVLRRTDAAAIERILQIATLSVQNEREVYTHGRPQKRRRFVRRRPHWRPRPLAGCSSTSPSPKGRRLKDSELA